MPADAMLYLSARDVARALEGIDVVEAVASALAAHARGDAVLPAEAYLGWQHNGETLRSLSMPAVVEGCAGVKIINANPANPARGLARASGLTLLFDPATGRPACVLEAARSYRTGCPSSARSASTTSTPHARPRSPPTSPE